MKLWQKVSFSSLLRHVIFLAETFGIIVSKAKSWSTRFQLLLLNIWSVLTQAIGFGEKLAFLRIVSVKGWGS